jgi:hypothetical protein
VAIGACCGLPWAVTLLGVSGAVALARLSFLLPYGLLGAVALLAATFWWAYRPVAVCADGTCETAGRGPLRWIVWAAAVLVVGLGHCRAEFRVRSSLMRILHASLIAIGLLSVGAGCTQDKSSAGVSATYTVLDDQGSKLHADFNRKVGSVRLLFVVDPICPGCLRGLADMNRDLLRHTPDPRLQTFVVHEPVLGVARYVPWLRVSGGQDVPKAAQLLQNPNVRHYWNPSGAFGRLLSQAVGLKNGERSVYTPGMSG